MNWWQIAGIALILLLIGAAIANLPMWIPFVLVGVVLLILLVKR